MSELVSLTNQHAGSPLRHYNGVVCNETMSSLHQIQHTFAFSDARPSYEKQSHPEHVGEGPVERRSRCEHLGDVRRQPLIELRGLELRYNDGYAALSRERDQVLRQSLPFGNEDARQVKTHQRAPGFQAIALREGTKVRDLGFSEYVESLAEESLRETSKYESRAGDLGDGNRSVESDVTGDNFELQGVTLTLNQIFDRECGHRFLTPERLSTRLGNLSSWFRSFPAARSIAVKKLEASALLT